MIKFITTMLAVVLVLTAIDYISMASVVIEERTTADWVLKRALRCNKNYRPTMRVVRAAIRTARTIMRGNRRNLFISFTYGGTDLPGVSREENRYGYTWVTINLARLCAKEMDTHELAELYREILENCLTGSQILCYAKRHPWKYMASPMNKDWHRQMQNETGSIQAYHDIASYLAWIRYGAVIGGDKEDARQAISGLIDQMPPRSLFRVLESGRVTVAMLAQIRLLLLGVMRK